MIKVILIGFVVSVILLVVINRSVFSWTGLISKGIGLCDYKSIGVPTSNGANQKLSQSYNLPQIASAMRAKLDYQVGDRYAGQSARVDISRIFNDVRYKLVFEHNFDGSEFNLSAYGSAAGGEKCTTPSRFLRRNVYRMIDDLPLNDLQTAELKQYVRVTSCIIGRLFF